MEAPAPGRVMRVMGRTMRWGIYALLPIVAYAFGSALFAFVQLKTGWGLSIEEAQTVRPGLGDTAGMFTVAALLAGVFAVLAIRVVRRLEVRADEP